MSTADERPPLRRAQHTPVAGVCLGLARHLGLSVPVVRITMIVLALCGGVGLVLYLWLWIFVPSEQEPVPGAAERGLSGPAVQQPPDDTAETDGGAPTAVRRAVDALTSSPEVLVGGLLLGASLLMVMQLFGLQLDWRTILPPAVIIAGVVLAWSQLDHSPSGPGIRHAALWQVGAGAFLVLIAMLVIAGGLTGPGELIVGIIVAAMLLAGLALVVAPWLIKLYRTSQVERARAAAEAERADIAAHLHDSVLQTLAMIQKQKADPAAVERLARRQERQLRTWLYRQSAAQTGSLKDQLLAVAAELEEMHSTPVEVVAVGESRRQHHDALVAAAREAMLNALRHAGPASVYIESTEDEDAVFIRDRGDGFDLDAIGEDRLGVRESIIGRMRRAGGEARIRSSERGTEVQLFMPVQARPAPNGSGTGPVPAPGPQSEAQPQSGETTER
ncbi:PspC domain-containing protein [Nesterenkonia sp.]|uniref:PspC domain-containing protein n=1 Tax=Nesterenkonia sp. TaxID=704201 RepID=UPI0026266888|nr:PspC domain-containing protein [Nesterenkonia sp.]